MHVTSGVPRCPAAVASSVADGKRMEGEREGREDRGTRKERRRYGILDGDEAGVLPAGRCVDGLPSAG
jgi:hypothetical protein